MNVFQYKINSLHLEYLKLIKPYKVVLRAIERNFTEGPTFCVRFKDYDDDFKENWCSLCDQDKSIFALAVSKHLRITSVGIALMGPRQMRHVEYLVEDGHFKVINGPSACSRPYLGCSVYL